MNTPPEQIDGQLVRLRRATPEDARTLFLAAAHPEVMRYMEWAAQTSDSETRQRLNGAEQRWTDGAEFQWIIEDRATGVLAGTISFRPKGHSVDFGYFLATTHWRKGFAVEAGLLFVAWLKEQPEVFRIWATADAENTRSHRVLERLGLGREGVLRMATYRPNIGGEPRDTVLYAWCKRDANPSIERDGQGPSPLAVPHVKRWASEHPLATRMHFSVSEATPEERPVVRHLLQMYLHEFSEFDGDDVDAQGLYHYPWVEEYWHAPNVAFLFKSAGNYAGFCLVDNDVLLPNSEYSISEFFVLRKYRKIGLGRFAASHIFSSRPGVWEVAQHDSNFPAQAYWRKVVAKYSNGNYAEESLNSEEWHGPVQTFRAGTSPDA